MLIKPIVKIVDILLVLLMISITITVFIQVISRFVIPIPWSEEFAKINLMWLTYLGLISSFYYDKHVRIDIIDYFIPNKIKNLIKYITYNILGVVFGYYLIKYTIQLFKSQLEFGQITPVLQWPMFMIVLPFIIGSILTMTYFLLKSLKGMFAIIKYKSIELPDSKTRGIYKDEYKN